MAPKKKEKNKKEEKTHNTLRMSAYNISSIEAYVGAFKYLPEVIPGLKKEKKKTLIPSLPRYMTIKHQTHCLDMFACCYNITT